jgi:type II secretory pathway component PulF
MAKSFFKKYWWIILLIAIIVLGVYFYWQGSINVSQTAFLGGDSPKIPTSGVPIP